MPYLGIWRLWEFGWGTTDFRSASTRLSCIGVWGAFGSIDLPFLFLYEAALPQTLIVCNLGSTGGGRGACSSYSKGRWQSWPGGPLQCVCHALCPFLHQEMCSLFLMPLLPLNGVLYCPLPGATLEESLGTSVSTKYSGCSKLLCYTSALWPALTTSVLFKVLVINPYMAWVFEGLPLSVTSTCPVRRAYYSSLLQRNVIWPRKRAFPWHPPSGASFPQNPDWHLSLWPLGRTWRAGFAILLGDLVVTMQSLPNDYIVFF